MGKKFGLFIASFVCAVIAILLYSATSWFFGIIFNILAAALAGGGATQIKNNEKVFQVTMGVVFSLVILIGIFMGINAELNDGPSWGDLSDIEKENARWAYEAQQAIDKYD